MGRVSGGLLCFVPRRECRKSSTGFLVRLGVRFGGGLYGGCAGDWIGEAAIERGMVGVGCSGDTIGIGVVGDTCEVGIGVPEGSNIFRKP